MASDLSGFGLSACEGHRVSDGSNQRREKERERARKMALTDQLGPFKLYLIVPENLRLGRCHAFPVIYDYDTMSECDKFCQSRRFDTSTVAK